MITQTSILFFFKASLNHHSLNNKKQKTKQNKNALTLEGILFHLHMINSFLIHARSSVSHEHVLSDGQPNFMVDDQYEG